MTAVLRRIAQRAGVRPLYFYAVSVLCVAALAFAFWRDRQEMRIAGPQPAVGLYWIENVDPTIGPGVSAPLWQLLIRTDTPAIYYKSGSANTAWTKIGSGAAAGGTVTSIACGSGMTCTPAPITTTGTVAFSGTVPNLRVIGPVGLASGGTAEILGDTTNQHALDLAKSDGTRIMSFYYSGIDLHVRDQSFGFDYMTFAAGTGYVQTAQGFQAAGGAPILITGSGQLIFNGTAVALACNGTGGVTCASTTCNNNAGTIVANTGATSCTVTFVGSPPNAPSCTVGIQDATILAHVTSETASVLTIGLSASASAKNIDYTCGFH